MTHPLKEYKDKVLSFCQISLKLFQANNKKLEQQQKLAQLAKGCWQVANQQQWMTVQNPTTLQYVRFAFVNSNIYWEKQQAAQWPNLAKWIRGYTSAVYLNQYFLQCAEKAEILDILDMELSSDQCLIFLETTLAILRNPPCPLYKYVVNHLKELCLYFAHRLQPFIHKKNVEDGKPTNRSRLLKDLIHLIVQYKAFDFLTCAVSLSTEDIAHGSILTTMLHQENLEQQHRVQLIQQLPFKEYFAGTPNREEVNRVIIFPIKDYFRKIDYKKDGQMVFQLAYLLKHCTSQFGDFCLDALTLVSNGKFPLKMVCSTFISSFGWKNSTLEDIRKAFSEMYHLYSDDFELLSNEKKLQHQFEYVNTFLIPNMNVITQCYQDHPFIKGITNGASFPILKFFGELGIASEGKLSLEQTQITQVTKPFISHIVSLLISLAFRSGTRNSSFLPHLLTLRKESCDEVARVCSNSPVSLSFFLQEMKPLIEFLVQTQEKAIESLEKTINKINFEDWVLNDRDCSSFQELLFTFTGGKEAYQKIALKILNKIPWQVQENHHRMKILELILLFSKQSETSRTWVIGFLQSTGGNTICEVHDIQVAEKFLNRLEGQEGDVIEIVRILTALSLCEKKTFGMKSRKKQGMAQQKKKEAGTPKKENLLIEFDDNTKTDSPGIILDFDDFFPGEQPVEEPEQEVFIESKEEIEPSLELWKKYEQEYTIPNLITILLMKKGSPALIHVVVARYVKYLSRFPDVDCSKISISISRLFASIVNQDSSILKVTKQEIANDMDNKAYKIWLWILTQIITTTAIPQFLDELIKDRILSELPISEISDALQSVTSFQTQILNYIDDQHIWLAYASILSLKTRYPELESTYSDSEGNQCLSTETFCQMWIASDCGQKLMETHHRAQSLLFWGLFFQCFHEACEKNGAHIFPSYLQRRFEKQFQLCAVYFRHEKNTELVEIFSEMEKWNYSSITDIRHNATVFQMLFSDEKEKIVKISYDGVVPQDSSQVSSHPNIPQPVSQSGQQQQPQQHASQQGQYQQQQYGQQMKHPQQQVLRNMYGSSYPNNAFQQYAQHRNQMSQSQHFQRPMQHSQQQMQRSVYGQQQQGHYQQQQYSQQPSQYAQAPMGGSQQVVQHQGEIINAQNKIPKLEDWDTFDKFSSHEYDRQALLPRGVPVDLPKDIFKHDAPKNQFVQKALDDLFNGNSSSFPLLLLPSVEMISQPSKSKFTENIRAAFTQYQKLIQEWHTVDSQYMNLLCQAYNNMSRVSLFPIRGTYGGAFVARVNTNNIVVRSQEALVMIQQNRKRAADIESQLHSVVEKLAIVRTIFSKINTKLSTTRSMVTPAIQEAYFSLLGVMLDMSLATTLNHIWLDICKEMEKLGMHISGVSSCQNRLLKTLFNAPKLPAQVTDGTTAVKNADRVRLFNGFNPSLLLNQSVELYIETLGVICDYSENLAPQELNYFLKHVSLDQLCIKLSEREPGTRFDPEKEDSQRLLAILRKALCAKHLKQPLGFPLLLKCLELSFPLEFGQILKLQLTLCQDGKYTEDDWHTVFGSPILLQQVTKEHTVEIMNIIQSFCPMDYGQISSILFVENLITKSQYATKLKRADSYSDSINEILSYYKSILYNEKDEVVPVHASVFQTLIESIQRIIVEIPSLIERLWDMYYHVLSKYTKDIAVLTKGQTSNLKYRQALSNTMQLVDWSRATFHETYPQILDEMWHCFMFDPHAICAMFNSLSWTFVPETASSSLICLFIRLYQDVNVFTGGKVPNELKTMIESMDFNKSSLWGHITPDDFTKTFPNSLTRLVRGNVCKKDPSAELLKYGMWMHEVASLLYSQEASEFVANELIQLMFLIMKHEGTQKCWHLPAKYQIQLLQKCLIPMAGSYMSKSLIYQVFGTIGMFQDGTTPILTGNVFTYFNSTSCLWDCTADKKLGFTDAFKKYVGIFQLYCHDAGEQFCRASLGYLLHIKISTFTKVLILEDLCHAFLSNVDDENPRYAASCAIGFTSEMTAQSTDFHNLLAACCEHQCPLLLTVLVNKGLDITIRDGQQRLASDITEIYISAVKYCLQCMPHRNKNYDLIYLYLYVLEMFESNYWVLSNKTVQEYTEKFRSILQFFTSVHVKDWKKNLFNKTKKPPIQDKDIEITPQMSLGCASMLVYLEKILYLKNSAKGDNSQSLLSGRHTNIFKSKNYDRLLKQQKKFTAYTEFWPQARDLNSTSLDMMAFRQIVATLFPLNPTISRISSEL